MAQRGQDMSSSMPFGYHADLFVKDSHTNSQQFFNQQAVLSQGDLSAIDQFFSNPNDPNFSNDFDLSAFGQEHRMEAPDYGGDASYESAAGTTHDPATTLGGAAPSGTYQTHSSSPQLHLQGQMSGFMDSQQGGTNTPDELARAASNLIGLSSSPAHGHPLAQARVGTAASTGSWGTLGSLYRPNPATQGTDQMLQGTMTLPHNTSPGSLYFPNMPLYMPNYIPRPNAYLQAQQAQIQSQSQWHNSLPHPVPLNVGTDAQHVPPAQYSHSAYSPIQQLQRPGLPQGFGSDPNFSNSGYSGPDYLVQEHEKAGNLLAVPFNDQLRPGNDTRMNGNGRQIHMHSRTFNRQTLPGAPTPFLNTSSTMLGGLPLTTPNPSTIMRSHERVWAQERGHAPVDDEEQDDEIEVAQQKVRKRRKSAMVREDEDEYVPGQEKAGMKRSAKALKGEDLSEDEDDAATAAYTTPRNKMPAKVHGSVRSARSSIAPTSGSQVDDMSPEDGEPSSAGKKRARNNASRRNLTEDEKRANHIYSEQKRRNVIKNGMEELQQVVPNLKKGKSGLSRADCIKEVVSYLRETIAGNRQIEELLQLSIDDMEDAEAEDDADGRDFDVEEG